MKYFILILALWLLPLAAWAQQPSVPPPVAVMCGTCFASISVSNSTSPTALPSTNPPYGAVTIYNAGTNDAYVNFGGSAITATTSNIRVAAGTSISIGIGSSTYIATITASSTTTLYLYQATGGVQLGTISTGAPSGPAGGDLAGSYPNPTVANLSNVSNASLANSGLAHSSVTIGGSAVSLGASIGATSGAPILSPFTSGLTDVGHPTLEGVTSTGATGTGKFVYATSPTLTTPTLGAALGTSLGLGGALSGSQILTVNGSAGVVSGSFGLSGNFSVASIGGATLTNAPRYNNIAATITDTGDSGTVAVGASDLFGGNTLVASSATTFTNYYGAYFTAPVASTNITMTNKWALGADSIVVNGILDGFSSGAAKVELNAGSAIPVQIYNAGGFGWTSANNVLTSNIDTSACREGPGVLEIGSGTTCGNSGTLDAASYKAGGTAGLTSCSVAVLGATITIKAGLVTAFTGC